MLDHILTKTLGHAPKAKEALFKRMFAELRPGLTHFLVHPAKASDEVAAISEDAPSRAEDHELFRDGSMAEELKRLGIKTTTYREIRDRYRAQATG